MLNRYPAWKNILIVVVVALGVLLALPNVFGEDPAVQVSNRNLNGASQALVSEVKSALQDAKIPFKSAEIQDDRALVRFPGTDQQLRAADALRQSLGSDYVVALNLAPRTPGWLRSMGLKPMSLGLDLRGGVHFLLQVDMDAALKQAVERYVGDIRSKLRDKDIRYAGVTQQGDAVQVRFRDAQALEKAQNLIQAQFQDLNVEEAQGDQPALKVTMTEKRMRDVKRNSVEQNITTLRNRVNELGVAEPIIQQQGESRIVVELPGVQDTARAKEILGATATLEFHLVDMNNSPTEAEQSGHVPLTDKLYHDKNGRPVLLKRDVIATGDQLTDAAATFDSQTGGPAVAVDLDSSAAGKMQEVTARNVGNQMAVVYIETKTQTKEVDGKKVRTHKRVETVINQATIQDVLGSQFQITGLQQGEAHNLALLLRAGALAAPVDIVEERTVGPSLGAENIQQGFEAVVIGFLIVVGIMLVYYRVFGIFANVALLMNVVLIVALLSLLQATLTMPGIAGIVLTVGMAVDANVLIYERIREELRRGNTPQAAIHAGYEHAFSTIADANITTLIAALVLFMFGTGPVKGFAVTLSLGIVTSMFTAIMGTRALVNLIYGQRRVSKLSI